MKTLMKVLACLLALAGIVVQSHAALNSEGNLWAVFDPNGSGTPTGYVTSNGIPNTGTMGGVWAAVPTNTARLTNFPVFGPTVITEPGGFLSVMFDGTTSNALSTFTTNQQSGGTNLPAPTDLTGNNPVHSVEVWAMAPTVSDISTLCGWGNSGASSNDFLFNYGASGGNVGGALNQGAFTLNWGAGGPPAPGVYHYLVTTYDGTNTLLYADGVLVQSSAYLQNNPQPYSFSPAPGYPINIGASRGTGSSTAGEDGSINGGASGTSAHARLHIAKVRIMDGVLTPSDIANNYTADRATFQMAPSTLAHQPIHDWVFNGSPGDAQNAPTVSDTGTPGGSPATVYSVFGQGLATYTGTALHMEGGAPTNGAFVDLGTNLISSMSTYATNNGLTPGTPGYNSSPGTGTGQVTVEGWLTVRGHPNFWQTYFAFGDTTATNIYTVTTNTNTLVVTTNFLTSNVASGKIIGLAGPRQAGPGGANNGSANFGQLTAANGGYGGINMWLFQQNNNDFVSTKMDLNGNSDTFYGGYSNTVSTPNFDDNWYGYGENQRHPFTMTHYACSWNEATGEILTYINGHEAVRNITNKKMFHIYDRNCWLGRDFNNSNPTLEGDYAEFRIYSNLLSPAEVLGNYEVGPGVYNSVSLTTPDSGSLQIVRTTSTSNLLGTVAYFNVTGSFGSGAETGVNVTPNNVTYSSSNPSAVAVTPGMLRFVGLGTSTITATYGGQNATATITVVPLNATMTHRFSFKQTGPNNSHVSPYDSVTATYIQNLGYGYQGASVPQNGQADGVLVTNGANGGNGPGWVDFGPNLISPTYDALTVEMWASFGAPNGTAPLFSFGDERVNPIIGGETTGVLSNLANGGGPNGALPMRGRYFIEAYSAPNVTLIWSADDPGVGGSSVNYRVDRTPSLNTLPNQHVVAEYNPTGGFARVYVNGVPTTQTNTYLPLLSALTDNYNYLGVGVNSGLLPTGAGQGPAPISSTTSGGGTENTNNMFVQEFRIYNGILPQSNVVIDLATGPSNIITNPGTLNTITLVTPGNILTGQSVQTSLAGNFANVSNVNMFLYDTNSTVFSSSTSNLTVNATGTVTGQAAGTAYLVASYPGFGTVSNLITIQSIIPVIQDEWSFTTNTPPSGPTNSPLTLTWDSIKGVLNATNFNYAYETNGQLVLTSNTLDFVQLPADIIDSNYLVLSIELWASYTNNGGTNAQNVDLYGFGNYDANTGFGAYYVSFSPHSSAPNITSKINPTDPATAGAGEVAATGPTGRTLDGQSNFHIVATFHPFGGFMQLYTNGVLAGTNTLGNLSPTALQEVTSAGLGTFGTPGAILSYIGKPLYSANQFINATVDEFRLYHGLMTQPQVMIDTAIGPNQFFNLNGSNQLLGLVTNVTLTINPNMIIDQTQTAVVTGAFSNSVINPVVLNAYNYNAAVGGTFPVLTAGNLNVIQIVNSNIVAIGIGSSTITATWSNKTTVAQTITVTAPAGPVALHNHWPFTEAVNSTVVHDVVNHADGQLVGAVSLDGAGHMTIPGVGSGFGPAQTNYVQMPTTNMLSGLSNATIEFWIKGIDQQNWARVFDFGEYNTSSNNSAIGQAIGSGLDYIMFTGNANNGGAEATYKPLSATYANDQLLVGGQGSAFDMPTNAVTYYAIVYNAAAGVASLYTNGVNATRNLTIVDSLTNFHEISNYFGRSHYTGDNTAAALGAIFTDFRIWTNAKSAAEIKSQAAVGPRAFAGATLGITNSPVSGKLRLTWPNWAARYGSGSLYMGNNIDGTETWTPVGGTPALETNATSVANTALILYYLDVTPGNTETFYELR